MSGSVDPGVRPLDGLRVLDFLFFDDPHGGTTYFNNACGTEFTTPDGEPYNPDFPLMARASGVDAARVEAPDDLPNALKIAFAANRPYLLEVRTRGDVPMPRTGYRDIADFLAHRNA